MIKIADNYQSPNASNILQVVAYHKNEIVLEENFHSFKSTDTMNVMSVTKAIASLLIGIAIDLGCIGSVDDYVMDYFRDSYTVKRGEKTIYQVTIRHLLTMTAPYKGKSEPWTKVCTSADWTKAALDFLGGREGITNKFRYHTLGTQILFGIIAKATKMNVLTFANQYLFEPLGIENRTSANCYSKEDQFNYLMNKGPHGKVWFLDPTDNPTAGWGLSLSALEMAKIGLLVLNNGVYQNKQIISSSYLEQMSMPYVHLDYRYANQSYGFLWWLPHSTSDVVCAIGDGGNIIYVNKTMQIVVAITGYFKPMIFDRVKYIEENIVKAIIQNI